jgi:hypothetical protein
MRSHRDDHGIARSMNYVRIVKKRKRERERRKERNRRRRRGRVSFFPSFSFSSDRCASSVVLAHPLARLPVRTGKKGSTHRRGKERYFSETSQQVCWCARFSSLFHPYVHQCKEHDVCKQTTRRKTSERTTELT